MTLTRRALLTTTVLTATLGLAACSGGGDGAVVRSTSSSTGAVATSTVDEATVGLTYIPNVQFAPWYVGIADGAFTDRGVTVDVRHHGSNEGLFTALTSGQEDLLIASGDEVVEARAKGLDVVAVASYYRRYPVELIVPEASPIKTVADLEGRTLGVPGRFGASWLGALAAFKDAGIAPEDVDVQEIGYTSQAALSTGKVDAAMGFGNNDTVQLRLAGVKVRTLPLTRTGSVPLVSISLVTTGDYAAKHPATVKAVADGMVDSIQAVADDPAGAIKDSTKFVPNLVEPKAATAARATLDATIPLMVGTDRKATGRLDPAQWTAMSAFMRAQGLIDKDVPADQAMRTDLVTR